MNSHARGAQICYRHVRGTMTFGFPERRVLVRLYHRPLDVRLFGDSDGEYMNNSVPWKRIHPAGPLE